MKLQGRNLSSEMQGADVKLLQDELAQLRAAIPGAESQRQFFGPGTRQAVLVFQRQHLKDGVKLTGIVDDRTAKLINIEVDALRRPPPSPPVPAPEPTPPAVPPPVEPAPSEPGFLVHGFVTQADSTPVVGGAVRVFDQNMVSRETLGDSVIGPDGGYAVAYEAAGFAIAEFGTADLVFEVTNQAGATVKVSRILSYDGGDRPTVVVGPIFNARAVARVDLVVDSEEPPGESEYERLAAVLKPLMQGVAPGALTPENLDFLSGDTGIDRRIIGFFATDAKLEVLTKISAPVFYGIAREGLSLEPTFLVTVPPTSFRSALKQALSHNIIPAAIRDSLDQIVLELSRSFNFALSIPAVEGAPPLEAVLSVVTPESEHQAKFMSLWAENVASPSEFWKKLGEDPVFADGLAAKIQQTFQLTLLTRGNIPLVKQIHNLRQQPLASLRELARLDANDWLKLIESGNGDLPPNVPGDNEAEKRLNYALELEGQVDQAFRTAAIARRISKENASQHAEVGTFLDANPDFEFDKTHIDSYLADRGGAETAAADAPELANKLKTMQRVFTVTPHYSEISVLMAGGIGSARAAARFGPAAFVARFGTTLGGTDRARELYNRAERTAAIAAGVFARFAPAMNSLDVYVTRRPS